MSVYILRYLCIGTAAAAAAATTTFHNILALVKLPRSIP